MSAAGSVWPSRSNVRDFQASGTVTSAPLTRARPPLPRPSTLVLAVPGLGPWTAHYIALRLGERDAFPADDLGLRRALRALEPEGGDTIRGLAGRWSPWRATAAAQLWLSAA